MKARFALGATALAALVVAGVAADPPLKSGPQVGSKEIYPFNPLHCSGPQEGTKICLV
jgi:hypothetical protein